VVPVRDDQVLLSFGGDGLLKAWDAESAKELWQVKAHDTGWTMSASLDGNRIVTGDTLGNVRVWKWDSDKPELLHEIAGHNLWIDAVAMSPDGGLIASASGTNTPREQDYKWKLLVHDTTTGELAKELPINNRIIALGFSRDGSRLAAGGWAGSERKRRLLTWDTESWNLSELPNGQSAANDVIACVALSPDGKHGFLESGSTGKAGEIAAGRYLESCTECEAERTAIKHSEIIEDGRRLITQMGGRLSEWDLRTGLRRTFRDMQPDFLAGGLA
jgi:WD40 repeat protein